MLTTRRCSRTGCSRAAVATLTYAYADSQAVLGPLALDPEPGCYDLCRQHADTLRVPRGWDVIRLSDPGDQAPSDDDIEALANAVREAAARWDELPARTPQPDAPVVELGRRRHLTVIADADARPRR